MFCISPLSLQDIFIVHINMYKTILEGCYDMNNNKIQELYILRNEMMSLIRQAYVNGENNNVSERLEMKLRDIERLIDEENRKLYA